MAMEGHSVPASSHSYIAQPISKRYEPVQVFQQPPHSAAAPTPINPQHYYSQQQQQPLQHQQQQQPPSMSPLTANLYTQHPGLGMQGYHPHYQAPNVQTLWSPMNILTSVAENVEEVPRSSSYSDVPMEKPKANAAQRGGSTSEPSPEAFAHPATAKEGNSKRQKRLERNRKSAQASRKRKKDTMIMAERRVRELAREVRCTSPRFLCAQHHRMLVLSHSTSGGPTAPNYCREGRSDFVEPTSCSSSRLGATSRTKPRG